MSHQSLELRVAGAILSLAFATTAGCTAGTDASDSGTGEEGGVAQVDAGGGSERDARAEGDSGGTRKHDASAPVEAGTDGESPTSESGSADASEPEEAASEGGTTVADAGGADTGHIDAGHADAGHDAGHPDAGGTDAGHADAGGSDTSVADASSPDAGGSDTSTTTAGGEMPIISFNAPAYSQNGSTPASNANDGTQNDSWRSNGYPTWLAYDLSAQPAAARQTVFVSWWAPSTYGYDADQFGPSYNLPGAYVLEGNAAPGGTGAAPTSGWVPLSDPLGNPISVTANVLNGREHLVSLGGMNWIRFNASAGASTNASGATDANIAMDVHDASAGVDSWNFIGDSITAFFQIHNAGTGIAPTGFADGNFSQLVSSGVPGLFAGNPSYRPAFNGNGEPGSTSSDWVTGLSSVLPYWTSPYVGIQLGANDPGTNPSQFYNNMVSIIGDLLAAGKTVYVATPSWQDVSLGHQDMSQLAAQVPLIVAHFAGSPVYAGPDMYAFFATPGNQTYISTCMAPGNCGLHPIPAGQAIMRNLWAQTAVKSRY